MTTPTNVAEFPAEPQGTTPQRLTPTRPLYWSVRREIWENRSIYIAPLVVACFALFGIIVNTILKLPGKMRTLSALDPAKQRSTLFAPYGMAASAILLTGFIVAVFYCLDALNSERRDRSILFWKSMPVSDRLTVLSKALIPFLVIPLYTYALSRIVQLIMMLVASLVLIGHGMNPGEMWARLPIVEGPLVMLYGLTAHVLWYAPIYAWLLLVSAWARRAAVLWAFLPFFALFAFERLALGTKGIQRLLVYRVRGAMQEAFTTDAAKTAINRYNQLDPGGFLTTPGLWLGLIFTALCLAAAVRLRRHREPN